MSSDTILRFMGFPRRIFYSATVEDKRKALCKSKDAREFLPLLQFPDIAGEYKLSDLLPLEIRLNAKDLEWLEKQLERKGDFRILQELSPTYGYSTITRKKEEHEIYLKEEARVLHKSLEWCDFEDDTEKTSLLGIWEDELKSLHRQHWEHYRELWMLEANMPGGPLRRAFNAWRKNPDWYLTTWLRQDCAGRGGCCGRECGCCEKPRDTDRALNRGHCTSACGCCVRSHGFKGDEIKFDDLKAFPFELEHRKTMYSRRIGRAYIWGIDFLNDLD
ncbi:hypothetical protein MW887_006082 [Aspergillus wentii]|nr:hypothetical protein MW887_006082 [Aspergillus wentii]